MSAATTIPPFDAFTAVDDSGATIDAGVTGFGGAHGGYVMALALRAMRGAVTDADRAPRSLSVQLLAPVEPGAADVAARVERAGGSTTAASVRIEQAGAPVALATASFGRARPSLVQHDTAMPDVPPPEDCPPLIERPVDAGVNLLVEHRPARAPLPLQGPLAPDAEAPFAGAAELVVWMRLGAEDRPVDALSATFLADAAAPALYGALSGYVPMPSAEIALHYADPASPGPWVLAVLRNRVARDGYAVEDGELWSPDGRLLLLSRQLRRITGTPRSA